jgi:hypothetical protein
MSLSVTVRLPSRYDVPLETSGTVAQLRYCLTDCMLHVPLVDRLGIIRFSMRHEKDVAVAPPAYYRHTIVRSDLLRKG